MTTRNIRQQRRDKMRRRDEAMDERIVVAHDFVAVQMPTTCPPDLVCRPDEAAQEIGERDE